jgi:NADH-quinone oxidoreductase subunit C
MSPPPESLVQQFAERFPRAVDAAPASDAGTGNGAAPAQPPTCQVVDFKRRGVHVEAAVTAEQVAAAARWLDENGYALDAVTGVDWLAGNEMEVVYDFFHPGAFWRVAVRVRLPRAAPGLPTISPVFPGANWHERETHEFFGIVFQGHPDLSPLLLPEDADYHPLRKDYRP